MLSVVFIQQPRHHTFRFLINVQTSDTSVYQPMAHLVTDSPQYCVLNHLPAAVSCCLQPGHHTFRFLINAQTSDTNVYEPMAHLVSGSPQYCVLNHLPLETLPSGVQVNSLRVPAPPVFKLMFHTHCAEAWIFYRYRGHHEVSGWVGSNQQRCSAASTHAGLILLLTLLPRLAYMGLLGHLVIVCMDPLRYTVCVLPLCGLSSLSVLVLVVWLECLDTVALGPRGLQNQL